MPEAVTGALSEAEAVPVPRAPSRVPRKPSAKPKPKPKQAAA
jgi:hypothetical protein